ncbi:MAG TPA: response regulator [Puia sp.]|nr:response regulator [Puia sp.]
MSKRIFLVDDDPIFIYLIKKMIEGIEGARQVEIFADGELAMARITAGADDTALLPDLILLDLNMPVLDGWGFLEQYNGIRHRFRKDIRIYIVSSTISPAEIERSSDYGFISGLVIKPPDRSKIAEIIMGKG